MKYTKEALLAVGHRICDGETSRNKAAGVRTPPAKAWQVNRKTSSLSAAPVKKRASFDSSLDSRMHLPDSSGL